MKRAAPARKSIVQLAYELQAAEDRKRKPKKEAEPAAPAPKPAKGRSKKK